MKIFKKDKISSFVCIYFIIIIIIVILFIFVTNIEYSWYRKDLNTLASNILQNIKNEYPDVSEEEIMEIFNNENINRTDELKKYGIDDNIGAFSALEKNMQKNLIINIILVISFSVVFLIIFIIYLLYRDRKIKEISNYIEEINNKNYSLKIKDNGEGELSNLKNELYKITVMLKEDAENSLKEKRNLSDSVSDISHQLKNPLTSIQIMLDNIISDEEMSEEVRKDFIKEINKQIEWINFLVISLLKLARFDAGVIEFKKEKIDVGQMISKVKKNLDITSELKDVKIIINANNSSITMLGDFNWQVEALTNIVKNCVEYTKAGGNVYISYQDNNFYTEIKIEDEGVGINKKDLKNIFKRFYKGRNSSDSSIGIGLNLAKAIIEKDNGYITCSSKENVGTTFIIKYMKN